MQSRGDLQRFPDAERSLDVRRPPGRRLDVRRSCALGAVHCMWLNAARSRAGALVQVLTHIPGHRAQRGREVAERAETRLLREGGEGLGQDIEAFSDDLRGGPAVG